MAVGARNAFGHLPSFSAPGRGDHGAVALIDVAIMEIRQTTPPDAYETLQRDPTAVYLDVRTPEEFAAGHPAGAINVPVAFFRAGGTSPNPDFVGAVQRLVPPATPLLVGCQTGGRSQRGAELLVAAGYADVGNVRGGFGGTRDDTGRVVTPGWRDAGLPVQTGPGGKA
jgi:rhodanese-related sulfurtransferase